MIFEALNDAADNGELLLWGNGMCHFHRRKDGVLTIREILVLSHARGMGIGSRMLSHLEGLGAKAIVARCPANLPANGWWGNRGFHKVGEQTTRTGRRVIVWRKELVRGSSTAPTGILNLPVLPLPLAGSMEPNCQDQ